MSRGLPPGLRAPLDNWLTAHIAPLMRDVDGWPEGGVRVALALAGEVWLLLVEHSMDAVGRRYPLVACVPLVGAGQARADIWADAVWPILLDGSEGRTGPDALASALADKALSQDEDVSLSAPLIWWSGEGPDTPEKLLPRLAEISSG